jgi:hypothetical protein
MAAATQRCEYFLRFGFRQFLASGGETSWLLGGVSAAHPKLQALSRLVDVLAHAPWECISEDMSQLLAKRWSQEELIHALVITSTVQCMCSFALGTGVGLDLSLSGDMPGLPCDFEKFYLMPPHCAMRYIDFDNKRGYGEGPAKRVYHYLVMSEFAWTTHASPIFQHLTQSHNVVRVLDREFSLFEEQHGRNTVLRTVSIHLFDLHGIKCDDFNYHELNKLLLASMTKEEVIGIKSFMKKAATIPHVVVAEDLAFGAEMSVQNKINLAHVVHVTRKMMMLLYIARAMHKT